MSRQEPARRPGGGRSLRIGFLIVSLPLLATSSAALSVLPVRSGAPQDVLAPADALPDTVEACQAMFDGKNDATWRAADGNISVALPEGRIAWLFGDTHRRGAPFVHNSVLVQEGDELTSPTGGQAVPNDADGDYYWPTDGLVDGGLLRVFVARVQRVAPEDRVGRARFRGRGVALATFTFDARGYPVYARKQNITRSDEDHGIQWGTAAVRDDDGYVYVYGQRRRPGEWVFGRDVFLARVPAGLLGNQAAWQYWSGFGWLPWQDWATPIERAESGRFASNFSVDKVGDSWVVVSKYSDLVGDRILEMRSPSPLGPFTVTGAIAVPGSSERWAYQAKGHAELPLANGRTLVTWNVGTTDPDRTGEDLAKPRCGEG